MTESVRRPEPTAAHASPAFSRRTLLGGAAGAAAMLATPGVATAASTPEPVAAWVNRNALRLDTADPAAPLDDLAALRCSIGRAAIVGLGESVHGTAEESTLKHRFLRLLVERMGFRSIAWKEQWTTGLDVDRYIRGTGDLDTLLPRLGPQWQTAEVADLLRWLREYNAGRAEQIRFIGLEFYLTPQQAYDSVRDYVARTAPRRLPRLRAHFAVIRPSTSDIFEYLGWFATQPDKPRYLRHARLAYELVKQVPHKPGDEEYARLLHTARQIMYFYGHYCLPEADQPSYRDAHAAANLIWWREHTGHDIGYWAASPHTANAPNLRIAAPPAADLRFPSAGSHLRRRYGTRYLSIGFTFDHGTVRTGPAETVRMPRPAPGWFERPFAAVPSDQFALDLRAPAGAQVRRWLHGPLTTRGLADRGPGSFIDGGSPAQWFDLIVHRQRVTPARPA